MTSFSLKKNLANSKIPLVNSFFAKSSRFLGTYSRARHSPGLKTSSIKKKDLFIQDLSTIKLQKQKIYRAILSPVKRG